MQQPPPRAQSAPEALVGSCSTCGGHLVFDPAGQGLRCVHCGTRRAIPPAPAEIVRLAYQEWAGAEASVMTVEVVTHTCRECGATTSLSPGVTSGALSLLRPPVRRRSPLARFFKPGRSLAESYSVDLPSGWSRAADRMKPAIESDVRSDIGGSHQRIFDLETAYHAVQFLHLLLPIWVAAYWFKNQSYRVLINGQTGEVHGQRPYSVVKILLLVLVLCAVGLAIYLFGGRSH